MKVFFVFSQPRRKWYQKVKKGIFPKHGLYSFFFLRQQAGIKVSFSDKGFSQKNLLRWIFSPIEQLFIKKTWVGFQLAQTIVLLPEFWKANIIIATNDSCGLPVAFFKFIGILKKPFFYTHIGFPDWFLKDKKSWFFKFLAKLLLKPEKIICYSKREKERLRKYFRIPEKRIFFIPFGVDTEFFKLKKLMPQNFIISIGRDEGRDYKTLFAAARKLSWQEFVVVCDPKNVKNLKIPQNAKVFFRLSYLKIRNYLAQANFVVLPLKKEKPSGQINILESLSSGKAVVVSRIPWIKDDFKLKDKIDCLFYQPENVSDLVKKIKILAKDKVLKRKLEKNAREKTRKQYSYQSYGGKIFAEIKNFRK